MHILGLLYYITTGAILDSVHPKWLKCLCFYHMQCWLSDAAATTSTFLTIYPSQGKLCPAMKSLTSPVTHTQLLYEVWWLQSPRMDAEKHYSHVANCSSFPFPNLLQIPQHFPQLFYFLDISYCCLSSSPRSHQGSHSVAQMKLPDHVQFGNYSPIFLDDNQHYSMNHLRCNNYYYTTFSRLVLPYTDPFL